MTIPIGLPIRQPIRFWAMLCLALGLVPAAAAGDLAAGLVWGLLDPAKVTAEAVRHEHGEGVKQDYAEARRLYCAAALAGDAEAAYDLAWMYLNGRGVERNPEVAVGWLRNAAHNGDRISRRLLKRMRSTRPSPDPTCPLTLADANPRADITAWVHLFAPFYDLEPDLVLALVEVESGFDPNAVSPKGAQGLTQLIAATARRFGVADIADPLQNLHGGMAYLRWLLQHFDQDLELALAGYNAGENAVTRYGGIPPYPETLTYVDRIVRLLEDSRREAGPELVSAAGLSAR